MLNERRLLLHLKCLVWCLHQMQTRYDLNLVLYSLEHHQLHPGLNDSNLGDNVAYLLDHLQDEDLGRVGGAMTRLPETVGSADVADKHFEIGHYIQAVHDFGPIQRGMYGIISSISPTLHGLFLVDGENHHLIEAAFDAADVRTIFGTYVI